MTPVLSLNRRISKALDLFKMFELFNVLDEKYQNKAISQVFQLVIEMSNVFLI